jgi:hypothetical protein
MMVNWDDFLRRLWSYPPGTNTILPPCPEDRIKSVEEQFGMVPKELVNMLRHFNGAKLFRRSIPLASIFGISPIPLLPPLEWAPEWTIDQYTPRWRTSTNRLTDWPIAIMNYGGLILLSGDGTIREWDRSQGKWSPMSFTFNEWTDNLFREGDAYLI